MPEAPTLGRLVADGLLQLDGARHRTTRRWQGAMARAAVLLRAAGEEREDLRIPIALTLCELYGDASNDEIATAVELMLPIEAAELIP